MNTLWELNSEITFKALANLILSVLQLYCCTAKRRKKNPSFGHFWPFSHDKTFLKQIKIYRSEKQQPKIQRQCLKFFPKIRSNLEIVGTLIKCPCLQRCFVNSGLKRQNMWTIGLILVSFSHQRYQTIIRQSFEYSNSHQSHQAVIMSH